MADTKYTFLPWIRKGISTVLKKTESNTDTGAGNRTKFIANVSIALGDNPTPIANIDKTISLMGPGDVLDIQETEIFRVAPEPDSDKMEWNYLPLIEFYDADLPWRYTPLAPHGTTVIENEEHQTNQKLRPWFYLLVLKNGEFTLSKKPSEGKKLTLDSSVFANISTILPPANEVYAWAHVHVNDDMPQAEDLAEAIEQNPNLAFSRIISPRRLDKNTEYQAFLIPSFETGRRAGLGIDLGSTPYYQPSWDVTTFNAEALTDATIADFPFYHTWKFKTSADGDFEALARKIEPTKVETLNTTRTMDISECGLTIPESTEVALELEGALMAPGFEADEFRKNSSNLAFVAGLSSYLNKSIIEPGNNDIDPVVTAPAYGKWIVDEDLMAPSNDTEWYKDLNLDPRNRVVAGLGAQIVKENQELFMEEAWDQIDEVNAANQRIREAKLIAEVGERIVHKHIKPSEHREIQENDIDAELSEAEILSNERLIRMTNNLHYNVLDEDTPVDTNGQYNHLNKLIDESQLPNAIKSGVFRKITRPGRVMSRRVSHASSGNFTDTLISETTGDSGNSEEYPLYDTYQAPHTLDSTELQGFVNGLDSNADGHNSIITSGLFGTITSEGESQNNTITKGALNLDITQDLRKKTKPLNSIKENVLNYIEIWDPVAQDFAPVEEFKSIMAYPELDFPLYDFLEKISKDAIIPNLHEVPENSVTLMETNGKFMEALFAGANHEMGRELTWRKYPTDQKGSYFRVFWDKGDSDLSDEELFDTDELHHWSSANTLGAQRDYSNQLILVVRGELLQKFPGTQIYAQKAKVDSEDTTNNPPNKIINPDTTPLMPDFKAKIGTDVTLIAFDLTEEQALGTGAGGDDLGYFFVFQERMGEMRFGLDAPSIEDNPSNPIENWNNLYWGDLALTHLISAVNIPSTQIIIHENKIPEWGRSSSDMANITNQKPVMYSVHATELLSSE